MSADMLGGRGRQRILTGNRGWPTHSMLDMVSDHRLGKELDRDALVDCAPALRSGIK